MLPMSSSLSARVLDEESVAGSPMCPLLPALENYTSVSDRKSREENPDDMQGIEGLQQPCSSGEAVDSPLLPNPVAGDVTLMPQPQHFSASSMEIVMSAMEDNSLTQPEAPICEIEQHTVKDATTFTSDAQHTAHPWPSPIEDLRSKIDTDILMLSLGTTFSPRKDVQDWAMPAALQYGDVLGDFPGDNDSIPAPGLLQSGEVLIENGNLTQPRMLTVTNVTSRAPLEVATSSESLGGEYNESAQDTTPSRPSSVTEQSEENLESSGRCDHHGTSDTVVTRLTTHDPQYYANLINMSSISQNGPTAGSILSDGKVGLDGGKSNELGSLVAPNDNAPRAEAPHDTETTSTIGVNIGVSRKPIAFMANPSNKEPELALNDEQPAHGIGEMSSMPKVSDAKTAKCIRKPKKKGQGRKKTKKDPTWKLRQNVRKVMDLKESIDATLRPASTPKEIIEHSYAIYSCAHIPLQFYYGQADLSQIPYNPFAVVLGNSLWKTRLVLNDDDFEGLPNQIQEITEGIPEKDDNMLINHLQGDVKPAQDFSSGDRDEIILAKARKEYDKGKQHQYGYIISNIRRFSYLLVLRYIYGQKKVYECSLLTRKYVPNSK